MNYDEEFKKTYFNVNVGETKRVTILGECTTVEKSKKDGKGIYFVYDFPIRTGDEKLKLRVFKKTASLLWELAGKPKSLINAVFDITGELRTEKDGTQFIDFKLKFINFKDVPNF